MVDAGSCSSASSVMDLICLGYCPGLHLPTAPCGTGETMRNRRSSPRPRSRSACWSGRREPGVGSWIAAWSPPDRRRSRRWGRRAYRPTAAVAGAGDAEAEHPGRHVDRRRRDRIDHHPDQDAGQQAGVAVCPGHSRVDALEQPPAPVAAYTVRGSAGWTARPSAAPPSGPIACQAPVPAAAAAGPGRGLRGNGERAGACRSSLT